MRQVSTLSTAVRNNGGGHYNHSLFWTILTPDGGGEPGVELRPVIDTHFGSFENFQQAFEQAATGRFGSGWVWLLIDSDQNLQLTATPNQDNPLMDVDIGIGAGYSDSGTGRLGARLLPALPKPPGRVRQGILVGGQLV